jgi:hypothetical protein
MSIVPTSLIKRPTAILSNILMIVVISLTAVPSVLHAVALRRVVCEFPGGCCIKSLRLNKESYLIYLRIIFLAHSFWAIYK